MSAGGTRRGDDSAIRAAVEQGLAAEADGTPPTERSGSDDVTSTAALADAARDPGFISLLGFLRDDRGFDFTGYKTPSLIRRIRTRMREIGVEGFEEYLDRLQADAGEFPELFNTILINVTRFFRDPESWRYLAEEALGPVLEAAGDRPIRVWSAGCASGEEAYSLAMTLADALGPDQFRRRVKIYATDVDEDALTTARQATYSQRELAEVPERSRARYFEQVQGRWQFRPELRRAVIFGRNDLTRDAPISRVDLLACRNTLMYFSAETQERVVSRLAYALRPSGLLFLGRAEMLVHRSEEFEAVELRQRLFRRTATSDGDGDGPGRRPARQPVRLPATRSLADQAFATSSTAELLLDVDGTLSTFNARAATMLGLGEADLGRPFQDLEISFRPVELRSHLMEVQRRRVPVRLPEVEWTAASGSVMWVDITITALSAHDEHNDVAAVSLSFADVTTHRAMRREVEAVNRQLELASEELQSTNEELETTNEELQSTVEELETTNEELQSANEELETMNEELQSVNDEAASVNTSLHERETRAAESVRFLDAVLGTVQRGVVVVDQDMRVRVWNRRAEDMWGLREAEVLGERLSDLDSGLPVDQLDGLVGQVMAGELRPGRLVVDTVDRRGRSVELVVSASKLAEADGASGGALLEMETHSVARDQHPRENR